MRAISTVLAGALFAGVAFADEVRVDVVFADDFEAAPATVFRIGSIALRDPHVFYFFLFCIDGTDELNSEVQQQLDADQDIVGQVAGLPSDDVVGNTHDPKISVRVDSHEADGTACIAPDGECGRCHRR